MVIPGRLFRFLLIMESSASSLSVDSSLNNSHPIPNGGNIEIQIGFYRTCKSLKNTAIQKYKRQKREFNNVMSRQFRTLGMFSSYLWGRHTVSAWTFFNMIIYSFTERSIIYSFTEISIRNSTEIIFVKSLKQAYFTNFKNSW